MGNDRCVSILLIDNTEQSETNDKDQSDELKGIRSKVFFEPLLEKIVWAIQTNFWCDPYSIHYDGVLD